MKMASRLSALALVLAASYLALAQAPAGATGACKDGSYTTNATKSGACSGHKGVKEWYADPKKAPDAATAKSTRTATPAPATAPAASPTPAPAPAAAKTTPAKTNTRAEVAQAPGGGAGQVWLNTDSNVYHCSGTKYYGKTKTGAYMTEAAAKAKGGHPDHGKACTQ